MLLVSMACHLDWLALPALAVALPLCAGCVDDTRLGRLHHTRQYTHRTCPIIEGIVRSLLKLYFTFLHLFRSPIRKNEKETYHRDQRNESVRFVKSHFFSRFNLPSRDPQSRETRHFLRTFGRSIAN